MTREEKLERMPIPKLFWHFSIPAIIGMIVQSLYNLVDRIFIGRIPEIGAIAIGGIGVTLPITFIFMGFSMLFGIGGAANISIKLGEKNKPMAERILGNVMFMLTFTGIILALIVLTQTDQLMRLFGATEENIRYASSYIRIIAIGNIWNTFAFAFTHLMRAEGNATRSMIAMFIGAGTNMILDPIFIFALNLGIEGAAYATIISQSLSLAWSVSYYLSGKSLLKITWTNYKLDWKVLLLIVSIGVSPFSMQIGSSVVGAVFNNALKTYGNALAQSSYITINSISMLFFMPIFGMNQGVQPIIGYNFGAKNFERVRKAYLTATFWATVVVTIGWGLTRLMPELLISIMTPDQKLIQQTVPALLISEIVMFTVGVQVVSSVFFQSIGKAGVSLLLSMTRTVIVLVPLLLILPRFYGIDGIWYSIPITDIISLTVAILFIIFEFRNLNRLQAEHNLKNGM